MAKKSPSRSGGALKPKPTAYEIGRFTNSFEKDIDS